MAKAAAEGTHRELLMAVEARIAEAVQTPNTNAVALAALSRQLILISKELSHISARDEDAIGEAAQIPDEPWESALF